MESSTIKVLIPTDYSIHSEFAYQMVQNLAKQSDIKTTFLHVLNAPDTVSLSSDNEVITCGDIDADYVKSQYEMAANKMADIKRKNEGVSTDIILGNTTSEIVKYAKKHSFDLIAMGTKGSSGFAERFIGSEAQHVARKSEVPVLTLMCDRSSLDLKNILLVHNFEENEDQSLDLLKTFISVHNTSLHFLQITQSESNHKQIKENMEIFASNNDLKNYTPHILMDSNVEEGVTHFEQMHDVDVVCIGTHGKGGILHKSATERLINHLYKPVISYKIK